MVVAAQAISAAPHRGVNAELHRLTRSGPRLDAELRAFLGFAYTLKAIADYETGPGSEVSPELATAAIERAERFVPRMVELVEGR